MKIEHPGEVVITADNVSVQFFQFTSESEEDRTSVNATTVAALEWAEVRIKEQLAEVRVAPEPRTFTIGSGASP